MTVNAPEIYKKPKIVMSIIRYRIHTNCDVSLASKSLEIMYVPFALLSIKIGV